MTILQTKHGFYNFQNSLGIEIKQYSEDGVIYLLDNTDEREILRLKPKSRMYDAGKTLGEQLEVFRSQLFDLIRDGLVEDDRVTVIDLETEWTRFLAKWEK